MRTLPLILALLLALSGSAGTQQQDDTDKKPADDKAAKKLILERAETVTFTTDEGTWMSLDVSPDGKSIAFDLLGDLYVMPAAGGEARRIVGGMSFESQPRFSPDGKHIAFLSDRSGVENLWIANADGSDPKAVSTDGPTNDRPQLMSSPAWAPDGDYLIVSKQRAPEPTFALFLYHRGGGTGLRIGSAPPPPPNPDNPGPPPPPAKNRLGGVVSPDGRFIYYTERNGSFSYNARFPQWQVIRFDRETGDAATITNAQGSAMRPVVSPDGKHMVYATRFETGTALRVRDLATGDERWLVHPVTRDDQESRASRDTMPGYAFMPDGQSLVVPIDGRIKSVDFATGAVRDIPFSAKVEAEIGPRVYFENRIDDGSTVKVRLVRWPALSPDGKRVAFTALNKLWVMDLPSGTPRRLTTLSEGEFMPAWSRDGRHLAFVTWSPEGGHINRVPADGGQPERLSRHAAWYSEPAYTPDGQRIVVLVGSKADQLFAELRQAHAHVLPEEDHAGAKSSACSRPHRVICTGSRRPAESRDSSRRVRAAPRRTSGAIPSASFSPPHEASRRFASTATIAARICGSPAPARDPTRLARRRFGCRPTGSGCSSICRTSWCCSKRPTPGERRSRSTSSRRVMRPFR